MQDLLFALMFDIEQKCQLENLYPRLDSNAEKYGTKSQLSRTGTLLQEILRDIFLGVHT